MKQGTILAARTTFSFKVNNKGRAIIFKETQTFWVTNSEIDQVNRGMVNIARSDQKIGYDFSPEQISTLFHEN